MKHVADKHRFCGNCTSHNAFEYPSKVFCTRRFLRNRDPIVQTLWCCKEYYPAAQECNCIADASAHTKKLEG